MILRKVWGHRRPLGIYWSPSTFLVIFGTNRIRQQLPRTAIVYDLAELLAWMEKRDRAKGRR